MINVDCKPNALIIRDIPVWTYMASFQWSAIFFISSIIIFIIKIELVQRYNEKEFILIKFLLFNPLFKMRISWSRMQGNNRLS